MRVLLVSTYELGHQPWHLASPAAALVGGGHEVRTLDLAVDDWDDTLVAWAGGVAFSVPMHTAMRLALAAAERVRAARSSSIPICFYGLYAEMAGEGEVRLAGQYEAGLVAWADGLRLAEPLVAMDRVPFGVPDRSTLPPLSRYARFVNIDGERIAGHVEASHGCAHRCRHCPVPVVYDGRVRMVTEDAVLADIAEQVDAGATHITFGDPDFLNAPQHSKRIVRAMHTAFPHLTFDCTVKVEHILRHADLWAGWAEAGCSFVVSAVESLNDGILQRLDKGHTAADAAAAVDLLRGHGIELRPSFLPFTPWTTVDDVVTLLRFVVDHDLVGNVEPVQYTIRLLLPHGSLLLGQDGVEVGPFDGEHLTYPWTAADPAVDRLQEELAALVERMVDEPVEATFTAVWQAVHAAAGRQAPPLDLAPGSLAVRPRLTEAWFCCAEPTSAQLRTTSSTR